MESVDVCKATNCFCKKLIPNIWKPSLCGRCLHFHDRIPASPRSSPATSTDRARAPSSPPMPVLRKLNISDTPMKSKSTKLSESPRNRSSSEPSPGNSRKNLLSKFLNKSATKESHAITPTAQSSPKKIMEIPKQLEIEETIQEPKKEDKKEEISISNEKKDDTSVTVQDQPPPTLVVTENKEEIKKVENKEEEKPQLPLKDDKEKEWEQFRNSPVLGFNEVVERIKKNKTQKARKDFAPSLTWFLRPLEHETDSIHKFAEIGSLQAIKQLVEHESDEKRKRMINRNDNINEQTPLHVAIENDRPLVAFYLIELGCDIHLKDKIGRDPFLYAYGRVDICKALVARGADANTTDCYGETCLHIAVVNGYSDVVTFLLLDTRIDVNVQNTFKETALHKAARQGDLKMAELLLNHGALCLNALQGKPKDLVSQEKQPELYNLLANAEQKEADSEEEIEVLLRKLRWKDRHTRMLMSVARNSVSLKDIPVDDESLDEVNANLQEAIEKIYDDIAGPKSPVLKEKSAKRISEGAIVRVPSGSSELRVLDFSELAEIAIEVEGFFEPYRNEFFRVRHLIFAIEDMNLEENDHGEKEGAIATITKSKDDNGNYEGLLLSKWGYMKFQINDKNLNPEIKDLGDRIRDHLDKLVTTKSLTGIPSYLDAKSNKAQLINDAIQEEKKRTKKPPNKRSLSDKSKRNWYQITTKTFPVELLGLETQLGRGKCYCIAVAYSKPGQTDEIEIFQNESSEEFETFLDILADKIEIKGWSGFSGGFNPSCDTGKSYYTSWRGFEIMFHVVPFLTPDQRRRLVANDKAIIYFQEQSTFTPSLRGNVNSVGVVVRPEIDGFGVACFARKRVKLYNPKIPRRIIADKTKLKDFIIATALNGIEATDKSPPFVYLYANSWQDSINELLTNYPKKKQSK